MKIYIPVERQGVFYLRLKNPLEAQRWLVSIDAYAEHERQYETSAIRIINPIFDKKEYIETELKDQWQYTPDNGFTWSDCTEPDFIGTAPTDYRYVFKFIGLEITQSYQDKAKAWMVECFGTDIATNIPERCLRFLEEALELVQACGLEQIAAQRLVTYVYNREKGDRAQETGGVMLTLACLSAANGLDVRTEGETELARVITMIPQIREKQQFKTTQNITA